MSDAADDARDYEDMWEELRAAHNRGECEGPEDCPYCTKGFEPLFDFQALDK